MTSRGKSAVRGFETEIEKSREEGNWKKVVELALQLKQRSPQHESLAHFLMGEGKLEAYLEECPPNPENAERAVRELGEARGLLTLATDEAGRRAGVALDAHLLLAKLHYACGSPNEALQHFQQAELDSLTEKELPIRSLRIVAESYAIKGLCVEATSGSAVTGGGGVGGGAGGGGGSRFKAAEREAEAVRAYTLAGELTLLYAQRGGVRGAARAAVLLDGCVLRAPRLLLAARQVPAAADRLRDLLAAVDAPTAPRLPTARLLAEVLLRAAPPPPPPQPSQQGAAAGAWRARRYAAPNQFVPRDRWEEVVLVLGVAEALAVRDAVLSQSAEFAAARDLALQAAIGVVDLLAFVATRWGQLALVLESLERAMKFSFGCSHVWRQRALGTAAAARGHAPRRRHHASSDIDDDAVTQGGSDVAASSPPSAVGGGGGGGRGGRGAECVRAASVMTRALPLCPRDAALRLVAADTAYRMGWVEEGIALSEEALKLEEGGGANGGALLARAYMYIGIGHRLHAQASNCRVMKEAADAASLRRLLESARRDHRDHLAMYHLALQHTRIGNLNDAMDACRACLTARADCAPGLRLAAALWSCACAGPRAVRALHAARLARHHYPRAAWPLEALAVLQPAWDDTAPPDAAMHQGKRLLALRATATSEDDVDDDNDGDAEGGAAGRARAWLALGAALERAGRWGAAAGCAAEAAALTPWCPRVLLAVGRARAAQGDWEGALSSFRDARAAGPHLAEAAVQVGAAHFALGWPRLAEAALRDACALEPRRPDAWRRLALVLAALDEPLAAADAAATALRLQPLAPVLPLPL